MDPFSEEDELPRENPLLNYLESGYVAPPVLDLPSVILPPQQAITYTPKSPCASCSTTSSVTERSLPLCSASTQNPDRMEQFFTALLKQNDQILKLQEQMASLLMREQPGKGQGSVYFYEEKRVERSIIDRNSGTTAQSFGVVTNRIVGNPVSEDLKRQLKEEILAELRLANSPCSSSNPPSLPATSSNTDQPEHSKETIKNDGSFQRTDVEGTGKNQETDFRNAGNTYRKPDFGNRNLTRSPRLGEVNDSVELASGKRIASCSNEIPTRPNSGQRASPNLLEQTDSNGSLLTLNDFKLNTVDEQTSIQEPVIVDIDEYLTSNSEDESGYKESEKEFGQALMKVKNIIENRKQVSFGPLRDDKFVNKDSPQGASVPRYRRQQKKRESNSARAPMTPIRKATFERVRELGASFVESPSSGACLRDEHNKENHRAGPSEVSIAMARLSKKYSLPKEVGEETTEQRRHVLREAPESPKITDEGYQLSISTRQYLEKYGLLK